MHAACFRDNEPGVFIKLCLRVAFDLHVLYIHFKIKAKFGLKRIFFFSRWGQGVPPVFGL